jgi:2-(1,2-epoxy-1,2-dihydrophenyl)acetyl-CoA isomerase
MDLAVVDGIARLTLNQSERGNPIDAHFCADICSVANELAERSDLRAILLSASGQFFSVGGDIEMFSRNLDTLPRKLREWTAGLHMGLARLMRLDAPIVACVHATAMGGSVAIISNCDVVVAARTARFGAGYPQIGYSCDAGASFGLASRMGLARARRFLLLNEMLDSEQAASVGLVDFVVEDASVAAEAEKLVVKLSKGPTRAYGEVRRVFSTALGQPFEAQLEDEAQGLARAGAAADAREGITAFVQKRKPDFRGR